MVSTLQWVLLGIGLYWILVIVLRRRGLLPSAVGTQGPILTLHTRRFRVLLDRIARPRRLWRAWGNFGLGVALVVMAGTFAFLAYAAVATVQNPPPQTAVNQPQNVLVIPGVNEFLPLSVAPEIVFGLLVGLVVHEGGHGIFCRVGDIDIKSLGIALVAVIPVGAFVEPDEESRQQADRGDQTRMFAAGVMNNFAVTLLAFALLFGPVVGSIGVATGAAVGGVIPGSTAAAVGIESGDRIVAINDQPIANNGDLERTLSTIPDREVRVTVENEGETRTAVANRSLVVTGITEGSPFANISDVDPARPTTIVAVNGTPVRTEEGLRSALQNRRVATLETDDGKVVSGVAGAGVVSLADEPLHEAGIPAGTPGIITELAGERIVSASDLQQVLSTTESGQRVEVELYARTQQGTWTRRTVSVVLGTDDEDDSGFLGVLISNGISGMTVSDFGTRLYPAESYLQQLGGGGATGSFFGRIVFALFMPFASVAGGLPYNFAGFTGGIANFYLVEGPLGGAGEALFIVANALFWTGWINLNLGVFNCIPAFPLDGGHILRTSTEAIIARLPVQSRRGLTTVVTTGIGLAMFLSLVVTLFGPQLLGG